jgi:hypothetical protein
VLTFFALTVFKAKCCSLDTSLAFLPNKHMVIGGHVDYFLQA